MFSNFPFGAGFRNLFNKSQTDHGEDLIEVCHVSDDSVDDGDEIGIVRLKGSIRSHVLYDIIKESVYLTFLVVRQKNK